MSPEEEFDEKRFIKSLWDLGILSDPDQKRMVRIAHCVKKMGIPLAGAGGLAGLAYGSAIPVPGIGSVAGGLAGIIYGLGASALACAALDVATIQQLRQLSSGFAPEDNQ